MRTLLLSRERQCLCKQEAHEVFEEVLQKNHECLIELGVLEEKQLPTQYPSQGQISAAGLQHQGYIFGSIYFFLGRLRQKSAQEEKVRLPFVGRQL